MRRFLCAAALAASMMPAFAAGGDPGVSEHEIAIGQIVALSGPLAAITPDIVNGANAWFAQVNDKGGIGGRKVRLVTLDDGYVPDRTVQAAKQLIEDDKVFALLNVTGTSNVAAIMPMLVNENVPLIGPITGAEALRRPVQPNVFHLRASYGDETEKMVQHLTTLGIRKVSAVYLDNGFGRDGMAGLEMAMARYGRKLHSQAAMQQDASEVDKAVALLAASQPDAIILITTGRATVEFIKRYNARAKGMRYYATSVMGTQATLKALGPDGVGVAVTSVVPFPWSASPAAREYRNAMQKAGYENVSFMGFESYLNAKLMTEGLKRAGPNPTRAKLIQAMEKMSRYDLGGIEVGYSKANHQGSRYVELTIIGRGEKFTK